MVISTQLPAWERLQEDFLEPGIPARIVVRRQPHLAVFVDARAARFGALFEIGRDSPEIVSPLSVITISNVRVENTRCLEVATAHSGLFRNLYFLLGDVVTEVVDTGTDICSVLPASLQRWQTLLQASVILSEERQAGLAGELWALKRLISSVGHQALDAWTGPTSQSHDFRLEDNEIEVKTTSGQRRQHVINGLDQLQPSPGCRLYILSIRLISAGTGGQTLPETISDIRTLLLNDTNRQHQFDQLLTTVGYRDSDALHYTRRRRLADAPVLVPAEDGCPRLTREIIDSLPAQIAPDRIRNAIYDVDLTGLGVQDGTPDFIEIIP